MELIIPDWQISPPVNSLVTTRAGGNSPEPWHSFNLGVNTGDSWQNIQANRLLLSTHLPSNLKIQWLKQVHGSKSFTADTGTSEVLPTADICYSRSSGVACAVLTADCLPILICNSAGSEVAAVHAGWRGLVDGVLAKALANFSSSAKDLSIWIGPAISVDVFEVGREIVEAMIQAGLFKADELDNLSKPHQTDMDKIYLDLFGIARNELLSLGVEHISGGQYCSYLDEERFYSYRRDGETGRMASLIWIDA
jgi:hypothetical protein